MYYVHVDGNFEGLLSIISVHFRCRISLLSVKYLVKSLILRATFSERPDYTCKVMYVGLLEPTRDPLKKKRNSNRITTMTSNRGLN